LKIRRNRQLIDVLRNKNLELPVKIPEYEYDRVRSYLTSALQRFDDVVALYEFGKVTVPGISDLDLAVVLKNEPKDKDVGQKIAELSFSDTAQKIFDGSTLMVFCEKHFSQISIWDDVKVKCIFGKAIELQNFPHETIVLLNICQIMDWLAERMLSILNLLQRNSISVMSLLGYLYSFHYTLQKIKQLDIKVNADVDNFNLCIKKLREEWFIRSAHKKIDELARLLSMLFYIGAECLYSVATWLITNGYYLPQGSTKSLGNFYLTEKTGYSFVDQSFKIDLSSILKEVAISGRLLLPVPTVWTFHLKAYASMDGIISHKLRHNFSKYHEISGTVNLELLSILQKRMLLCNDMAEFLYAHHFKKGLYKFGWLFP